MNIQIFGKAKCFDTKKAERYFKERGIKYQYVDILSKGLSRGELDSVTRALGGIDAVIDENSKDYAQIKYLLDDAKPDKLAENPKLYTLVTEVYAPGGKLADRTTERIGVRTLRYGDGKFLLNGKARKFKGVCLHHDLGPLGAAFDRDAFRR